MKSKSKISLDEMTSIITSLLRICKNNPSKRVQAKIKHTIKTLLSPDFWGKEHAVSEKALKFAKVKGYTQKDLSTSSWDNLGDKELKDEKKEKLNGKRGLILEHIILRSDLLKLLLECDLRNSKEIKKIIGKTKCAVIHWKENAGLKKYERKRPDPKEAYKKIKLIGYKDISDFIDLNWVYKKITPLYHQSVIK